MNFEQEISDILFSAIHERRKNSKKTVIQASKYFMEQV